VDIESRLAAIEARNARVDQDKAWETSITRRISIAVITYGVASGIFLFMLPSPNWYLAALVPVVGYLLSTLALPFLKKTWQNK
jgi:hypothetical protein